MRLPCCHVSVSEDEIWNAMDNGDSYTGVTNRQIQCPRCNKPLTVFLSIDSIQADEEEEEEEEND